MEMKLFGKNKQEKIERKELLNEIIKVIESMTLEDKVNKMLYLYATNTCNFNLKVLLEMLKD